MKQTNKPNRDHTRTECLMDNDTSSDGYVIPGAEHTMREIAHQPALWRQVPGRVIPSLHAFVDAIAVEPGAQVVLTGASTSSFADQMLAPALRKSLHRRVDAVATTDIVADPSSCFDEDVPTLLVSFARSGDSPESVAAADLADHMLTNVKHVVFICNAEGHLARDYGAREDARVVLMPDGVNDQGFAMTSNFTSMTLAALLALDATHDEDLAVQVADIGSTVLSGWRSAARELSQRAHKRVVYRVSCAGSSL